MAVGTPGRLLGLLRRGALPASRLKLLVLDEADKLLDPESFGPEVAELLDYLPEGSKKQVPGQAGERLGAVSGSMQGVRARWGRCKAQREAGAGSIAAPSSSRPASWYCL